MQYDRKIIISTGCSRKATVWPAQELYVSELYEKLKTPARGVETLAEYLRLKKAQQDDLKDVGGFVAGSLAGNRRKASNVLGRDVLTLDLDNIPAGATEDVLRRLDGLGCNYCVYSTRKHQPSAPRLRVLFPLDRTVTADEYEPLARKAAEYIDPTMQMFDPSTFEPSRLMYWSSCCADSCYVYQVGDKPFLYVDGLLGTYADWHDFSAWPQVPGQQQEAHKRLAAKQGDPLEKNGILGAFCRCYSVYDVLDKYIPGVYTPTDIPDRYTYAGGSTNGGAVVYDDGKFIFSHHATDPAGGRLCNAFDLVRLHKFGAQDDDAKPDTPVNKLPSYKAMTELATTDPAVLDIVDQERERAVTADFGAATTAENPNAAPPEDPNWKAKLTRNGPEIEATIDNIWKILENDPLLRGKFALNRFSSRGEVLGPLPWSKDDEHRFWDDNDSYGLYWYMEKRYHICGSKKVDGALSLHSRNHSFNEVTDYLSALSWDGIPRLSRLFIDYLGAADTEYTRAVTRKAFVAAVARAMSPGCKFDQMTVISGPQGIGKSTLLRIMGKKWFSDSVRDFSRLKETAELLQGVWIVEVGELGAMRSADVNRVKQLMSQQIDRFRAAYGHFVSDCPRCCIFFGTSNDREYLQDKTGNRRFWPVDTMVHTPEKNVFKELEPIVDQLWAEAVEYWRGGESLYLTGAVADAAKAEQEKHLERSPWEGTILEFLEREVPLNWNNLSLSDRQMYWQTCSSNPSVETVPRERVCAQEIWCEALRGDIKYMKRHDALEINSIIEQLPGWERAQNALKFGCYGAQKGFIKKFSERRTRPKL